MPFQYEARSFIRQYDTSGADKDEVMVIAERQKALVAGLLLFHAAMAEGFDMHHTDGSRLGEYEKDRIGETIAFLLRAFSSIFSDWREVDPHITRIADDVMSGEL